MLRVYLLWMLVGGAASAAPAYTVEADSSLGRAREIVVSGVPDGAKVLVEGKESSPKDVVNGRVRFRAADADGRDDRPQTYLVEVHFSLPDGERVKWKRKVELAPGERALLPFGSAPAQPLAPGSERIAKELSSEVTNKVGTLAEETPAAMGAQRGHIHVVVTLDTKLFINGKLTLLEGEVRDFATPPIAPGETYVAKLKFDFRNKTGRRIIRTHEVRVKPGETVSLTDQEGLMEVLEE